MSKTVLVIEDNTRVTNASIKKAMEDLYEKGIKEQWDCSKNPLEIKTPYPIGRIGDPISISKPKFKKERYKALNFTKPKKKRK